MARDFASPQERLYRIGVQREVTCTLKGEKDDFQKKKIILLIKPQKIIGKIQFCPFDGEGPNNRRNVSR